MGHLSHVEAYFIIPITQNVRKPKGAGWDTEFYTFALAPIYNKNGEFTVSNVSGIEYRVFKTIDEVLHTQCYTLLKYDFNKITLDMGGRVGIYQILMNRIHCIDPESYDPAGYDTPKLVSWFNLILATMYEDYYGVGGHHKTQ